MVYFNRMLSNKDITKLKEVFATKAEFHQVINMLDGVMGELKAIREEQTIMFHKLGVSSEKIDDHEGRINIIESGLSLVK